VITGANKGIGYAIAKALAKSDILVVVTARDESLGKQASHSLVSSEGVKKENLDFHQLDITDAKSIDEFGKYVEQKYGGIDILVNNAGMAFKGDAFDEHVARTTIATNYYGTLAVLKRLLPSVRDRGRVVNVSSSVGKLTRVGDDLVKRLTDPNLTVDGLNALMESFIDAVAKKDWNLKGWPTTTYGVSKIGVTALTRVLAHDEKRNVLINSCCPGYVKTDMSSGRGPLTPDQGAETPVFLALLPPSSKATGGFYYQKSLVNWANKE